MMLPGLVAAVWSLEGLGLVPAPREEDDSWQVLEGEGPLERVPGSNFEGRQNEQCERGKSGFGPC